MPADVPNGPPADSRWEAVLADIQQAEEAGRTIDAQHYLDSFPDLADALRGYFRDRDWFARVAPRLAPTARPAAVPVPELPPGSRFAGYEIIRELGRGGMGIVYHARQLSPQREVALKVIRTDRLADLPADEQRQWLERFRREAQLVASLEQHPNLVTLYEVGEHEGRPFFTMQLVRGGSLAETVGGGQPASRAARLLATVARAVDHVHRRGVLHRDLKPGNILLDEGGRPLVSDFGLARRLDQSGSLVAGAIEGTAEYMAPEQARGLPGAVTTAADVYSLGAVLYALLTGRPPFQGTNKFETLLRVLGQEPAPPRSLNPRVPRDLELICLKCLEKEPGRRYASAAALADDLERWLAGRPVVARPVGAAGRLWRWCRRQPVLAGALGCAAAALVVVAVVASVFAVYREESNRALGEANQHLEKAAGDLNNALESAKTERNQAVLANQQLRAEQRTTRRLAAGLALDRGREAWAAGEAEQGLLWLTRSLTLAPDEDAALQEAIRINLAGWRATVPPPRPVLRHPGVVARAGFTPDGARLVTLSTGTVGHEQRQVAGGKKSDFLVFRPEVPGDDSLGGAAGGRNLLEPPRRLASPRGGVFVWDVASGKPAEVKPPPDRWVLAVSPDGRTALTAKRTQSLQEPSTVAVWDLSAGKLVGEETRLNVPIRWAVCGGDGKAFAAIGDASLGSARLFLWDAATGAHTDFGLGSDVYQAATSPDGKVLAVVNGSASGPGRPGGAMPGFGPARAAEKATVTLFDLATRKELPPLPDNQAAAEAAVAVGPGGRLVLTVSPPERVAWGAVLRWGAVHLWDQETKQHRDLPFHHLDLPDLAAQSQGRVAFAQFSPDGKVLLTASGRALWNDSEEVRLWDTATGRPRGAPLLPRGPVQAAAFSPDSKLVAIGCGAGEVQLWETATGRPLGRPLRHPGPVFAVAFSPDGSKLVTGGYDGTARVWDTIPGTGMQPARWFDRVVAHGVGRCLRREANTVRLHDLASGLPCGEPIPWTDKDRASLGPDERTVVIVAEGNTARLWDAVTGKPIGEPLRIFNPVTAARFSPDGKRLLLFMETEGALSALPYVERWDTATGRALGPETNPHVSMALASSPDGRLALRGKGPVGVIVDVAAMANPGKAPARPGPAVGGLAGGLHALEHPGPVTGGLFSPDGRTLLTTATRSGSWHEARLWEVPTGKPLGPPLPHQGPIRAKVISADGKLLLTGSDDGTARLWDAATGKPLGPPLTHGGRVLAVALRPDGKLAATAGEDGTARLWHVATGKPLGPSLPHPAPVTFVTFGAGGETLITAAGDRVGVWKVPQALPGAARRLLLEAEIETGMELDDNTPRLLDDAERARRSQQLQAGEKAPRAEGGR